MTCKIERVLTPLGLAVFRVNGRIDCAFVAVLLELIEIELRNCPAYVREWISQVRERELAE
jgi:hypothetical protein